MHVLACDKCREIKLEDEILTCSTVIDCGDRVPRSFSLSKENETVKNSSNNGTINKLCHACSLQFVLKSIFDLKLRTERKIGWLDSK